MADELEQLQRRKAALSLELMSLQDASRNIKHGVRGSSSITLDTEASLWNHTQKYFKGRLYLVAGSDRIGSDLIGSDRIRSDRIRSDRIRSDRIRSGLTSTTPSTSLLQYRITILHTPTVSSRVHKQPKTVYIFYEKIFLLQETPNASPTRKRTPSNATLGTPTPPKNANLFRIIREHLPASALT